MSVGRVDRRVFVWGPWTGPWRMIRMTTVQDLGKCSFWRGDCEQSRRKESTCEGKNIDRAGLRPGWWGNGSRRRAWAGRWRELRPVLQVPVSEVGGEPSLEQLFYAPGSHRLVTTAGPFPAPGRRGVWPADLPLPCVCGGQSARVLRVFAGCPLEVGVGRGRKTMLVENAVLGRDPEKTGRRIASDGNGSTQLPVGGLRVVHLLVTVLGPGLEDRRRWSGLTLLRGSVGERLSDFPVGTGCSGACGVWLPLT